MKKCSICLDTFSCLSKIKTLECNHSFHSDCIKEWLRIRPTCPLCRKNVDTILMCKYELFIDVLIIFIVFIAFSLFKPYYTINKTEITLLYYLNICINILFVICIAKIFVLSLIISEIERNR
jgi:hypothetical protein